jgi:hypothetical protein
MDKQEILATFGTKDTRQRQSKQNKKQINTENYKDEEHVRLQMHSRFYISMT